MNDRLLAKAMAFIAGGLVFSATQGNAQSIPPGVQDIVKLVKAGISEDVVLAQIQHNGAYYNLTSDQIIALHDQGVTQAEIKALMGSGGSPAPAASVAPPVSAPPPPSASPGDVPVVSAPLTPSDAPTLDTFRAELSPYGAWVDIPGYGVCWRPSVEQIDPGWRPYFDSGHWEYSDAGWAWQSDYPWGSIPFHYGRWFRSGALGWVWAPAYDWAPAWVAWRKSDGFCGWAPLPPTAVFRPGVGLWFGGRVALDVDFGLREADFSFVAYDRFWERNLHAFLLPPARLSFVFGHSLIMNGYRLDHGRFFIEGLGRDHMASLTHHEIRVIRAERGFAHERAVHHEEQVRRDRREDQHDRDRGHDHDHDRRDRH